MRIKLPALFAFFASIALVLGVPLAGPAAAKVRQSARVSCVGAAALAAPAGACPPTTKAPVSPTPEQAALDRSDAYRKTNGVDCFAHPPAFKLVTCQRGASAATAVGHVALVGNSHAGHWLSAVEQIAAARHWQVTTFLASGCALSDLDQHYPDAATVKACHDWVRAATRRIAGGYGLIIISNKVWSTAQGHDLASSWPLYQKGYESVLRSLARTQRRVLGIRDTPSPGLDVPSCLRTHPTNYAPCTPARSKALPPEPLTAAMATVHSRKMMMTDMTKYFCTATVCPGAIGRVPVYFDSSHVTATYARTAAPYLTPAVMKAVHL